MKTETSNHTNILFNQRINSLDITNITFDEYLVATDKWEEAISNFSTMKEILKMEYVFSFDINQINWLKANNQNTEEFRIDMGVFNNQVMLILIPLDSNGSSIEQENYECALLKELETDLVLTEKQTVTTTKNFVFSKEGKNLKGETIEKTSIKKPAISIDNAVEIIENWRNNAVEWFHTESTKYRGQRVFRKFYVPIHDVQSENLTKSICTFALKETKSGQQKYLPTLVFINHKQVDNFIDIDIFDWTKPEPPYRPGGGGFD
ncbi:hypothetical protein [Chryseobacterium sp. FH1]|uniref:hypothetical protein n=1 Tax=Chryseobacterium sp. FH1 TaxID=1233951 RepID=UPI0004E3668B|nr:hypothetical protein [Chryseobacterium sp. FH1]KFC24533.1 hypothetical protein IO90_04395 [Chryseobacterium sp. FH1]